MIYGLLLAGIVVIVLVAIYGSFVRNKHKENLAKFAAARGWALVPPDPALSSLSVGDPFQAATRHGVRATLRGYFQGHEAVLFDYVYTRQYDVGVTGGTKIERRWVGALLDLPGLPRLQVVPRTGPTRAPWAHGMAALATGDPQFDQRFSVHTDDPRWALALLGAGLGRFLLASPDLSWRIDGRVILAWQPGRIDPAAVDARLQHLLAIAGQAAAVPAG